MPIEPSVKMQSRQARWLVDTIRIWTESASVDVDANGDPTVVESDVWEGVGLARQDLTGRQPGQGRVFGERVMAVKIDGAADPETGMRFRIVDSRDTTLVGAEGTIVDVDRDTIQAVRRFTVRMDTSR